jgi:hypothetical protein
MRRVRRQHNVPVHRRPKFREKITEDDRLWPGIDGWKDDTGTLSPFAAGLARERSIDHAAGTFHPDLFEVLNRSTARKLPAERIQFSNTPGKVSQGRILLVGR